MRTRAVVFFWTLTVGAAVASCATSPVQPAPQSSGVAPSVSTPNIPLVENGFSILQGLTHETGTQITVVVPKTEQLKTELTMASGGGKITPAREERVGREDSNWEVLRLRYEGLRPGLYVLRLRGEDGSLRDERTFKTLNRSKKTARVAITSCSDDFFDAQQKQMWPALISSRPDLILMIGDNVYADWEDGKRLENIGPATLWRRYATMRNRLLVYRSKELVPILATWDDHDYGMNDGDRTYPHREESRQIFMSFFAQEPMPGVLEGGPGVASRFNGFGQRFYLMDDRSFRSPNKDKTGPQTHWGKEQEEWLYAGLSRSRVPTWVVNGDQFFGAYHRFESYAGNHPESFKGFIQRAKQFKAPFFLVSGDRHLAEMMRIPASVFGFETLEFTTSGVHAKMFPDQWSETPNSYQIHGRAMSPNFGLVESSVGSSWQLDIQALGPGLVELFRERVSIRK